MKIDITVVFENGKELQLTNADKCAVDSDSKNVEVIKNGRKIFINFDKILYVGVTQDLN